ncbi:hypothetical protein N4R57_12210 [Rhodobacteraceae bacterium D3-12]|nr:hypothetical protein N4R57_12210 [Rhodobacteraceae bacterium D3-12]
MKKLFITTAIMMGVTGAAHAGSLATIDQVGTGHSSSMQQVGNSSVVVKQRNQNQSAVGEQFGNGNNLNISQRGNGNIAGKTVLAASWLNSAQTGTYGANLVQQGNNNKHTIKQKGVNNNAASNHSYQQGNNNDAKLEQMGKNNSVQQFRQRGNGNTSTLKQTGNGNHLSFVFSIGNGNDQNINQQGTKNGVGNLYNNGQFASDLNALDNVPFLAGTDMAALSASKSVQIGNGNKVDVDQTGSKNGFNIEQGTYSAKSYSSKVKLNQKGSTNFAYAAQSGAAHTANVSQMGSGNRSFTNQSN